MPFNMDVTMSTANYDEHENDKEDALSSKQRSFNGVLRKEHFLFKVLQHLKIDHKVEKSYWSQKSVWK